MVRISFIIKFKCRHCFKVSIMVRDIKLAILPCSYCEATQQHGYSYVGSYPNPIGPHREDSQQQDTL